MIETSKCDPVSSNHAVGRAAAFETHRIFSLFVNEGQRRPRYLPLQPPPDALTWRPWTNKKQQKYEKILFWKLLFFPRPGWLIPSTWFRENLISICGYDSIVCNFIKWTLKVLSNIKQHLQKYLFTKIKIIF